MQDGGCEVGYGLGLHEAMRWDMAWNCGYEAGWLGTEAMRLDGLGLRLRDGIWPGTEAMRRDGLGLRLILTL